MFRRRSDASKSWGFEDRRRSGWAPRTLLILGGVMVSLGIMMLQGTPWWRLHFEPSYEWVDTKDQPLLGDAGFASHFPLERLTTYRVGRSQGLDIPIVVAEYHNEVGQSEHAMVYQASAPESSVGTFNPRMSLWEATARAILAHASPESLYLTWWDNAQRVHLLTGEATSPRLPVKASFSGLPLQEFWGVASGGYAQDVSEARQFAQWLVMDADKAVREIRASYRAPQSLYLLACVDDLARLSEIERLSGVSIPLEARYFPAAQDLHAQIKEVRRWVNEKGEGTNYLVQPVSGGGVRAWRVTSAEGANLLLVRLLPFSHSLETLVEGTRLVYQSHWGGYISIHELISPTDH